MSAQLYLPVYFTVIGILCVFYSVKFMTSPGYRLQEERTGMLFPTALSLILVFWLGFRPISGAFGDTVNYAMEYKLLEVEGVGVNWQVEWVWRLIQMECKDLGFSVSEFFTVIEAGYIFTSLWAVKKFVPTNPMLGMLFMCSSLMFFSFGTNGLRNGLACHIVLLAIAFFLTDVYWAAALLALMAFGIHRSVILPIVFVVLSRYVIKNFKVSVWFWLVSIALSVILGKYFLAIFASLGFDSRMASYNTNAYAESFSSTGFRWDFLVYSLPPIALGWYAIEKKKIQDGWFRCLVTAYCFCNSFWVLVIRSAFSNRFAYLSWFMYPILIVYPLLNMPLWNDQDKKIGLILLVYSFFSIFMNLIVW